VGIVDCFAQHAFYALSHVLFQSLHVFYYGTRAHFSTSSLRVSLTRFMFISLPITPLLVARIGLQYTTYEKIVCDIAIMVCTFGVVRLKQSEPWRNNVDHDDEEAEEV
jgi:hypothetical protein